ncbi:polysaccharide deacetylase family protein [Paenibacillus lignilyticus]|uniref:Polysaccharide deacetylase family protein n=1 Tax=Paenibacillus lignilyticus TaxID=1172615 RepID=A0ABS5CBJ2_9BACL|nr:polysaccharide deacetylase family protein [Paenibacillus lignilyticus]MBP3963352.1 polysaccharide deacetylase family protein [Paenibacillus lignilyticus]
MKSTAELLGYGPNDRLLIINADDFGLCHSSNKGIQKLLEGGIVSSATIMMPCAWAREAAVWSASHTLLDVGVHFTLTSEWDVMKWGPVYRGGSTESLVTGEGYFHRDSKSFERRADTEQVKQELIAQVEMALHMGVNVTHADNHMGSLYGLQTGRHFLTEVFDVCAGYRLPFRLPRFLQLESGAPAPPELALQALKHAAEADRRGVAVLDYLVALPFHAKPGETYAQFKSQMISLLKRLKPGVSELIIHPALVTDELTAFHSEPLKRGMEMDIFRDKEVQDAMHYEGIKQIGWKELRHYQRRNSRP